MKYLLYILAMGCITGCMTKKSEEEALAPVCEDIFINDDELNKFILAKLPTPDLRGNIEFSNRTEAKLTVTQIQQIRKIAARAGIEKINRGTFYPQHSGEMCVILEGDEVIEEGRGCAKLLAIHFVNGLPSPRGIKEQSFMLVSIAGEQLRVEVTPPEFYRTTSLKEVESLLNKLFDGRHLFSSERAEKGFDPERMKNRAILYHDSDANNYVVTFQPSTFAEHTILFSVGDNKLLIDFAF